MTQAPDLPLIGSAQVCEQLGINRSTLSRWVATGKITPAFKNPGVRGSFVFTADEVERLATERAA